jgi:DNA-binding winged helix-turn-helix (wHTH) protein/tetratricopeptide (TPR) repeat protein
MSGMTAERSTPSSTSPSLRLRFNQFELDEADARLTRAGQPVPLAPKPFSVLCALARTPRMLVTKNALLDAVWGHRFVSESVLKSTISELRAALEDDAKQPRYIETVSRRGYRFIAAVNGHTAAPAALPGLPPSTELLMIGRAQPLERLRAAWQFAAQGRRQVVWIAGEAGVGKTTLAERFMVEVGDAHYAHGQCVEQYGAGEPYLPVLEALTALCRRDKPLAELIRSVAPTWLLQLPWLSSADEREALRRDLAGVGPARMLRELAELLDRYTENRPLLLITEDLHWSDQATVQLMDYIARRRASTRLLWLASFRLTEIVAAGHPLHAVRTELRLHGLAEEIVLDAFSEREVAQYVAERLPARAGDETFVRALHGRTDGLPLFVADVVKEVLASGVRPGSMAIPMTLTGVIERYIRQLAPAERALLEAASVCGAEFRLATVSSVLERDAASIAQACTELAVQQRWLTDVDERYVFRHALYREVLYKRIAPLARVELHRKVAAGLEEERTDGYPVSAVELASHFELGRQPLPALRYYVEAAEAALGRFRPEECMTITERASPLLQQAPQGPERDTLELAIGTLRGLAATRALGAGSEAKSAMQRAYSLLDEVPQHPMRGRLLHGFGFMLYIRAEYAEALAVADRALSLGAATNDAALLSTACSLHGQVDHLQGRPRSAQTWLERGLAPAERLDVAAGEFLVDPQVALLGSLSIPLVHLGLIEHARACAQRAHARARDRGWPMARLVAIWHSALLEVRLENPGRVATLADELHALLNEFALAHGRTGRRLFRGWADARMGQAREGYRGIRDAYEENARLGMLAGATETLGYATEALILACDLDGARKQLEEALKLTDKLGERVYLTQLHLLAARIADALGEPDAARESMRLALAEARAQEAPWLEMLALSALCERPGATAKDRASLRAALDRISGGEDAVPVAKAWALLKP